ncbi:MAG: hypothetical protein GWN14_12890 [candidate division Zixibacteria bacterium]|nr:hypothetical protein [Gammaproteobacteria bacterium]NIX56784.1 hypothetical protein [candidate division Zixibacteria bacterium]
MSEEKQEYGNLKDEFRSLGENLKDMINAAWESDERKTLQGELEEGMQELGNVLNEFAANFQAGEVGQSIRHEVDEISERVRSGELEDKARQEILKALKIINGELEKASQKFSEAETDAEANPE